VSAAFWCPIISLMHPVKTFFVRPALPERLQALEELAYNLRWSWDHATIDLFRRLDRTLWDGSGHNPVLMLGTIARERLEELAQDEAFLAHLDSVAAGLRYYVARAGTWYQKQYGQPSQPLAS
jgi:starch phosphorylase